MNESAPRIINKLKERLQEQQQKHKSLQQLKSSIEEVCVNPIYIFVLLMVACFQLEKLTSQEIPVKTNELSSTNQELKSVENDLKKVSKIFTYKMHVLIYAIDFMSFSWRQNVQHAGRG